MSENPYQPPVPDMAAGESGYAFDKAPSALKAVCILCVILGALGLFGSLIGIAGLLFQQQLSEFQIDMADPSQMEMQTKMAEAQASFFIPNMFITIFNLLLAPFLLVGGIGILMKKTWGQKILSCALIAATAFIIVRTVLTSIFQMQIFGVMKETMIDSIPTGGKSGGLEAGTMETIMMTSMYFGVALGVVMSLSLAVFYFWSWRYLKKDHCQRYLNTFST